MNAKQRLKKMMEDAKWHMYPLSYAIIPDKLYEELHNEMHKKMIDWHRTMGSLHEDVGPIYYRGKTMLIPESQVLDLRADDR